MALDTERDILRHVVDESAGTLKVTALGGGATPADVNISEIGGNTVNTNGGNIDTGTQTVAIADDDNVSTKLTSIDGKVPASLGQKASASSLAAVLSTEQEAILTALQTALQIIDDWDATHNSAVGADGAQIIAEAKDFDGAALPNSVTEGNATRIAASLNGVQYAMPVSKDGSQSPYDSINNSLNVQEIAPVRDRSQYNQIQSATAIADTNENQLGGDIDVLGYNTITFGWDWQQSAAETVTVRIYGMLTSGGNEYQTGTWSSGAGSTETKDDYAPADNVKESISIDVSRYALIKITLQATVAAGTFECEYLLKNNG